RFNSCYTSRNRNRTKKRMEETTVSYAIHHPVPAQWARSFFLALLPVLAVFLGGATSKWAEGIIVAFFGAFLVFQPPRRSLGWKINATFLAFALCALLSFLPQTWFFTPDWRTALTNDFGIALPSSVTPQPWLSAGCFASLVAGLSWLYRVSAQELELRVARFQLRLFACGIVAIAALRLGAPARAGAACRISLAVSFLLLLVSALLVAGGQTLARFHFQKFAGTDFLSDFRWLIFHDTWQLIRSAPWVGLGLGNFES